MTVSDDESLTIVTESESRSSRVRRSSPQGRDVAIGAALAVGAVLLAATVRVAPDSTWFTVLALSLAANWAVGARAAGPIQVRPISQRSWQIVVLGSAAVGFVAYVVFLAAYLVARNIPVTSAALDSVLDTRTERGLIVLVIAALNGLAEELFFRGALFRLVSHQPIARTTALYVAVTSATGNIALIVAAAVMGVVFALERRDTGSVLSPVITHVTWSTLMLLALPR